MRDFAMRSHNKKIQWQWKVNRQKSNFFLPPQLNSGKMLFLNLLPIFVFISRTETGRFWDHPITQGD